MGYEAETVYFQKKEDAIKLFKEAIKKAKKDPNTAKKEDFKDNFRKIDYMKKHPEVIASCVWAYWVHTSTEAGSSDDIYTNRLTVEEIEVL